MAESGNVHMADEADGFLVEPDSAQSAVRPRAVHSTRLMLVIMTEINKDLQFAKDWVLARSNSDAGTGKVPACERIRSSIVRDVQMQAALTLTATQLPNTTTLLTWVSKAIKDRQDRTNAPGGEKNTGGTSTSADNEPARALDAEIDSFLLRVEEARRAQSQSKDAAVLKSKRAVRLLFLLCWLCLLCLLLICLLQMALQYEAVLGCRLTRENKKAKKSTHPSAHVCMCMCMHMHMRMCMCRYIEDNGGSFQGATEEAGHPQQGGRRGR